MLILARYYFKTLAVNCKAAEKNFRRPLAWIAVIVTRDLLIEVKTASTDLDCCYNFTRPQYIHYIFSQPQYFYTIIAVGPNISIL